MSTQSPDEISLHNPIDRTKTPPPTDKWRRNNYGDMPWDRPTREAGEVETDRDMDKPLPQLASDIHETYFQWARISKEAPYNVSKMKEPVKLILFALARNASMNAKVALTIEDLNQKLVGLTNRLVWYTRAIFVLTIVAVLVAIIALFFRN